jgi:hypothetical protein
VAIFCAEELRPAACVVADALVVRGFSVTLQTGPNARKALQLSLQGESRGLRVLCVPQALDRKTHRKLYEGLDGDLRGDLLVVPLQTPRAVIEAVEARHGVKRSRPRRRYTKAYLPHPTIAESSTGVRRLAGYGLLAAAGTAAVAVVLSVSSLRAPVPTAEASVPVVEHERPSLLLDDPVLGAAVPEAVEIDEPAPRRWRRRAREVARLRAELALDGAPEPERSEPPPDAEPRRDPAPVTEPEEVIVIEDDSPAEAAPELVAPPIFGRGAPGLPTRRVLPVDPFASNPVEPKQSK